MHYQMDSLPSFDITRDAAGGKFRTWASNSSPLQNTLPPTVLRPYLQQGCLGPQQLEPCSASPYRLTSPESRASPLNVPALEGSSSSLVPNALGSQPPRVSPSTGPPSTIDTICGLSLPDPPSTRPLPDFLPSGQSTVGPGRESPEAFFTAALGRSEEERVKKRVKLLVGVVEGFAKVKERPHEYPHEYPNNCPNKSFWSKLTPTFKPKPELGSETESTSKTFEARYTDRLRRLKQIRDGMPKENWQTGRIWLICVAHEVEHISQWDGIDAYTSKGVDRRSAAIKIVVKHLDRGASNLLKRCNNIVYLMKVGGPAAVLLDNGARSRNIWEREMTLDDITLFYRYKRDRLSQTKSHDQDAAYAIRGFFLKYGWSSTELLFSNTKVMEILGPYLQRNARDGPGESDINKRQRLDQPGAFSCLDHFALDRFSLGKINQATSSGIDNTVGSMPRSNSSHLISFNARHWTRNLTDPITRGNLDYAFSSSDEFSDPAIADDFSYAIDNSSEATDPATRSNLDYAFNRGEFTSGRQNNWLFKRDQCLQPFNRNQDLKRHKQIHLTSVLGKRCRKGVNTVNNSGEITDLATADFVQNTHNQSMNALPNFDHETNSLTDPATDMFLQAAIPEEEFYLMNFIYPSHDEHLPNASTLDCIESTDNEKSDGYLYAIQNMIPRPLDARYTMGDESRKYATEPDSIVIGPLSATSGKTRVPSASMPMMPLPSAELGYLKGSGSKTSEYTIGQAIENLPFGLPPRL